MSASIEVLLCPTQSQSDEPSDLLGSLSPTSVYSTWQSQAVTHPILNRVRRCLTSVIEQTPMGERRIPYIKVLKFTAIIKCFLQMATPTNAIFFPLGLLLQDIFFLN